MRNKIIASSINKAGQTGGFALFVFQTNKVTKISLGDEDRWYHQAKSFFKKWRRYLSILPEDPLQEKTLAGTMFFS
jgi:hypothetical protein